jgi:hypothetical protein
MLTIFLFDKYYVAIFRVNIYWRRKPLLRYDNGGKWRTWFHLQRSGRGECIRWGETTCLREMVDERIMCHGGSKRRRWKSPIRFLLFSCVLLLQPILLSSISTVLWRKQIMNLLIIRLFHQKFRYLSTFPGNVNCILIDLSAVKHAGRCMTQRKLSSLKSREGDSLHALSLFLFFGYPRFYFSIVRSISVLHATTV